MLNRLVASLPNRWLPHLKISRPRRYVRLTGVLRLRPSACGTLSSILLSSCRAANRSMMVPASCRSVALPKLATQLLVLIATCLKS